MCSAYFTGASTVMGTHGRTHNEEGRKAIEGLATQVASGQECI